MIGGHALLLVLFPLAYICYPHSNLASFNPSRAHHPHSSPIPPTLTTSRGYHTATSMALITPSIATNLATLGVGVVARRMRERDERSLRKGQRGIAYPPCIKLTLPSSSPPPPPPSSSHPPPSSSSSPLPFSHPPHSPPIPNRPSRRPRAWKSIPWPRIRSQGCWGRRLPLGARRQRHCVEEKESEEKERERRDGDKLRKRRTGGWNGAIFAAIHCKELLKMRDRGSAGCDADIPRSRGGEGEGGREKGKGEGGREAEKKCDEDPTQKGDNRVLAPFLCPNGRELEQ